MQQFHDNRFTQCHLFLFCLANQIVRHAACRAVKGRVDYTKEAFDGFKELCRDREAFIALIDAAIANPRGREESAALKKIMPIFNLSSSSVPWSLGERGSELPKLIALERRYGPFSNFFTAAPNDVYDAVVIRYSHGARDNLNFPSVVGVDEGSFLDTLRGGKRSFTEDRGGEAFTVKFDDDALQLLAAQNPVACMLRFDELMRGTFTHLLGLPPSDSTRATPAFAMREGVLGALGAWFAVVELNEREAPHWHAGLAGGASPALLANLAGHGRLQALFVDALSRHVKGALSDAAHAADTARRLLKVKKNRLSLGQAESDPSSEAYIIASELGAAADNLHGHVMTCTKGKRGEDGCRLCRGATHSEAACGGGLSILELVPKGREGCTACVEFRCDRCYLKSAGAEDVESADAARNVHFAAIEPSRRGAVDAVDARALVVNLKRPAVRIDGAADVGDDPVRARQCVRRVLSDNNARAHILAFVGTNRYGHTLAGLVELILAPKSLHVAKELAKLEGGRSDAANEEVAREAGAEEYARLGVLAVEMCSWWAGMVCRNAMVTEWIKVITGELGCNTAPIPMGGGVTARISGYYMCKYNVKEKLEPHKALAVLVEARKHADAYPSGADDTGTDHRTSMHTLQRAVYLAPLLTPLLASLLASLLVPLPSPRRSPHSSLHRSSHRSSSHRSSHRSSQVIKANLEMAGVVAAALITGVKSSLSSDNFEYLDVWGARRFAKILYKGGASIDDEDLADNDDDSGTWAVACFHGVCGCEFPPTKGARLCVQHAEEVSSLSLSATRLGEISEFEYPW